MWREMCEGFNINNAADISSPFEEIFSTFDLLQKLNYRTTSLICNQLMGKSGKLEGYVRRQVGEDLFDF